MTTILKRHRLIALEFAIVAGVFLITSLASQIYQLHITYHGGRSFDGVFYYQVADQIAHGRKPSSDAPFVYRIGTPLMVALFFEGNLLAGFKVVNIIGNVVAVILLALWLRLFLKDWRIRTLLVALFITQWHGPVRFTYYDPVYTDPWLFVLLLIGLIGIQRVKAKSSVLVVMALGVLSFVGVVFREIVLILPISLAFTTNPILPFHEMVTAIANLRILQMIKKLNWQFLFPLVLSVAGLFLVRSIAYQTNNYSFTATALDWIYNKQASTYIHAYFITYGPLLILPVFSWRTIQRFLSENQHLLVFMLGFMVIGWIGGSDTERFLYWAMPVVFVLIGIAIQENKDLLKSPLLILFLAATTVCSQRLFWTVPDFPNRFKTPLPILSFLSSRMQYLDLWSWFGARPLELISLAEYLIVGAIILLWLYRRATSKATFAAREFGAVESAPPSQAPQAGVVALRGRGAR
jgi:hypothetical protein